MIRTPVGLWYRPNLTGTPLGDPDFSRTGGVGPPDRRPFDQAMRDEMSLLDSTVAAHRTR